MQAQREVTSVCGRREVALVSCAPFSSERSTTQGGSTEVLLSSLQDAVAQRTSEQAGAVRVSCPQLHTMEMWKEM